MSPPAAVLGDPPPEQPKQPKQQHRQDDERQEMQALPVVLNGNTAVIESDDSILSELSSSESELSSVGTMSPPPGYLSPATSHSTSEAGIDSIKPQKPKKRSHQDEEGSNEKNGEEPAPKKRRSPEPKPRIRQNLDVRVAQNIAEQGDELATLLKALRKRRKIVVVAGAGISVSAGIPDFRSSTGLFKSLKSEHKLKASGKALFDASVYQTDSSTSSFHDMVRNMSSLVSSAKPTPFHRMLERLGDEGRLMRLYTQNVDGIDTSIPSLATSVPLPSKGPWPRSVQLHGGLEKMVCTKCHHLASFEPELFSGPAPPPCRVCIEADKIRTSHAGKRSHGVGRLRPRMVLYNEHNPDEEAIGSCVASDLRARPDALIVVGTSMKIPGVRRIVKEMCGVVRSRRDGITIWMNHDDTPPGKDFEDVWDLVIKGPCDEVARQWQLADVQDSESSNSDAEKMKEVNSNISVVIPPSPTKVPTQLVTPDATPKQLPTKPAGPGPRPLLKLNPPRPVGKAEASKAVKAKTAKSKDLSKKTGLPKKTASGTLSAQPGKVTKKVAKKGGNKPTASKPKNGTAIKATVSIGPVPSGIQSHFQIAKTSTKPTAKSQKGSDSKDPMEPISPSDPRVNGRTKFEPEEVKKLNFSLSSDDIPHTPLRVEIPGKSYDGNSSRRSSLSDTISPTSVPKGMADLLA